jgi:hypothetical protein
MSLLTLHRHLFPVASKALFIAQISALTACGDGSVLDNLLRRNSDNRQTQSPDPTDPDAPLPAEPTWRYPWERPGLEGFVPGPGTLGVMFEAKGDVFGIDIGIARALMENINPAAIDTMMYMGSSSGSLGAAYFACNGLSPESVEAMVAFLGTIREKIIPDPDFRDALDIVGGVHEEKPLTATDPLVTFVTNGRTCVPRYPFLLVAGNKEIVDDRDGILGNTLGKTMNAATFDVWSDDNQFLGKACTYFVNEPAARILERVSPVERLCDIRPVASPADLVLAIRASIAEPTYFQPVPEPSPNLIRYALQGAGHQTQRLYYGGFINTAPSQDIKRGAPEMRIFSTGRNPFGLPEQGYMSVSFNVNLNDVLSAGHWWTDSTVDLPEADWKWARGETITMSSQVTRGYQIASACLKKDSCRASNIAVPPLPHRVEDWNLLVGERQSLRGYRGRGLGPMLKK